MVKKKWVKDAVQDSACRERQDTLAVGFGQWLERHAVPDDIWEEA